MTLIAEHLQLQQAKLSPQEFSEIQSDVLHLMTNELDASLIANLTQATTIYNLNKALQEITAEADALRSRVNRHFWTIQRQRKLIAALRDVIPAAQFNLIVGQVGE